MALDFVWHPFWQRLSSVLVHFAWQALAVAAVFALVLAVWRPRQPQTRYAAALAALFALPCCAVATFFLAGANPHRAVPGPESPVWGTQDAAPAARQGVAATQEGVPGSTRYSGPGTQSSPRNTPSTPSGSQPPVPSGWHAQLWLTCRSTLAAWLHHARPWLVVGWLVGVTLFSLRMLLGAAAIVWIRRRAVDVPAELLGAARRLSGRLGVNVPCVVASPWVTQALAAGLFKPVIVLPASWASGLSPAMVEAVLAHELAHLKRHDVWVNLVQRMVETAFFYHPVVWWLSAKVRAEREVCCDDLAVAATGDRLGYAAALELAAGGRRAARELLLANGLGGRKMAVLERVRRVLNLEPERRAHRWWPGGVAALALPALVWCAAAAWQPAWAEGEEAAVVQPADDERPREEARRGQDEGRRNREPADGGVERAYREAARQVEGARRREREAAERALRNQESEREAAERARERDRELRARQERERARDERERRFREQRGPAEREPEGFRPRGPRDADERGPRGPRDFDFRVQDGRERGGLSDMEIEFRRDLPPAQRELLELMRELRREVEELRREVRELRESRPTRPFPPGGPPWQQFREGGREDDPRLRRREGGREEDPRGEFRPDPRREGPPERPLGPRDPFGPRGPGAGSPFGPRGAGPRDGEGRGEFRPERPDRDPESREGQPREGEAREREARERRLEEFEARRRRAEAREREARERETPAREPRDGDRPDDATAPDDRADARRVPIPALVGLSWKAAEARLSALGLRTAFLRGRAASAPGESYTVYEQIPQPGHGASPDEPVRLRVFLEPDAAAR